MAMTGTHSSSNYYIPAVSGIYASLDRFMLPLLRIVMGLLLVPHGCQKFFGWFGGLGFDKYVAFFDKLGYKPGGLWVAVVAATELIGGLLLAFGLFTRFAAAAIVIFMINSVIYTSAKGFFWTSGGMEYSILIGVVALVFLVKGGGEYSIDRSIGKEL